MFLTGGGGAVAVGEGDGVGGGCEAITGDCGELLAK